MKNQLLRCFGLGAAALSIGLAGCSKAAGGEGTSVPAPDFPKDSGQPPKGTAAYPAAPYGVGKGSVIANYQFIGFANAKTTSDTMQPIQMADFYNPHADDATYAPTDATKDDRLFPVGSPYGAGTKKPKALLIDVASVWCGPCNEEAKSVLPALHAKYKPCGGEFLLQLADGATPGKTAEPKNLSLWTSKYKVDYPATIDPTYKLGALFDQAAFPANMIIDTRTMTVVQVIAGVPDSSFWTQYEKVLNDKACLAGK